MVNRFDHIANATAVHIVGQKLTNPPPPHRIRGAILVRPSDWSIDPAKSSTKAPLRTTATGFVGDH